MKTNFPNDNESREVYYARIKELEEEIKKFMIKDPAFVFSMKYEFLTNTLEVNRALVRR